MRTVKKSQGEAKANGETAGGLDFEVERRKLHDTRPQALSRWSVTKLSG